MKTLVFCFVTSLFLFLCLLGFMFYNSVIFKQNCEDYLKLAADANNISIAKDRLDKAIQYIEDNKLTSGNSGVVFTYPSNDLSIWYNNLKAAQNNLEHFPNEATETDVSTTLVKLRETLLDHNKGGDSTTLPDNISIFPHQVLFYVLLSFSMLAVSILFGWLGHELKNNSI